MKANEAFKLASKNEEFNKAVGKIECGCVIYKIGNEVFSRSYCECDGYKNHKMSDKRAEYLIKTNAIAFSF